MCALALCACQDGAIGQTTTKFDVPGSVGTDGQDSFTVSGGWGLGLPDSESQGSDSADTGPLQDVNDWDALCAAQTTLEGCQLASAELPDLGAIEGCVDCMHGCLFTEVAEVLIAGGTRCLFGDRRGVCYYSAMSTEHSLCDDPYIDVPYCGHLAKLPVYFEDAGKAYLGMVCSMPGHAMFTDEPLPPGLRGCKYDLWGASHPACDCPCTFEPDAALECMQSPAVCRDEANGLMWPREESAFDGIDALVSTDTIGAMEACQDWTWGGFDDWRLPSLDELRTLVRGCPSTEADGACTVGDACSSAGCAQAPCVVLPYSTLFDSLECESPLCANDECLPPAIFAEGPCAPCLVPGQDPWECNIPEDLGWPCDGLLYSSTPVLDPPASSYGTYWSLDPVLGVPVLNGYIELEGTVGMGEGQAACVRNL